ncbi:MAG TPA: tRNA (adenosine(37)-N6)-threonylcarbamoyltransferase complex dimerization subunit type 1 TsaB [Alkalispirochaeta sp.]|nr:tRNA (adenosine(37)-N6)-threonylcarbamoyltransferase complex dimerization subunit type 1 TsaB [Alkalispirochaeta sp.]
MNRLLAIDTAGPVLGLALLDHGHIHYTADHAGPLRHVEQIVPRIDAALTHAGWPLNTVDAMAISAGPGSFTGLRVGMAAAKAVALAGGIPLVSVDTLMALAATERYRRERESPPSTPTPTPAPPSTIIPVLDARKQRVYAAAFRNTTSLDRLAEDGDLTLEGLREMVRAVRSSADDGSWCAPGPMGAYVSMEAGYVAALVQSGSAAPGTALVGYSLVHQGLSDTSYHGPFYLRNGDIGARGSVPRFAPTPDHREH